MVDNTILTWQDVCDLFNIDKKTVGVSSIINISKSYGIGNPISFQKAQYNNENLYFIKKIIDIWSCIINHSAKEFNSLNNQRESQKIIVQSVLNNQLIFFSIFCPSYKKGVGLFGYNRTIGINTKFFINKIFLFLEDLTKIDINIKFDIYFSDLILENYEKIKDSNYL